MKVWNQIALGLILAVPTLGQTVSPATSPAVPILLEIAMNRGSAREGTGIMTGTTFFVTKFT
jgi:hypothetical protein